MIKMKQFVQSGTFTEGGHAKGWWSLVSWTLTQIDSLLESLLNVCCLICSFVYLILSSTDSAIHCRYVFTRYVNAVYNSNQSVFSDVLFGSLRASDSNFFQLNHLCLQLMEFYKSVSILFVVFFLTNYATFSSYLSLMLILSTGSFLSSYSFFFCIQTAPTFRKVWKTNLCRNFLWNEYYFCISRTSHLPAGKTNTCCVGKYT